jgi:hypothetical protein
MKDNNAKVYIGDRHVGFTKIDQLPTPLLSAAGNIEVYCESYLVPCPEQRINGIAIVGGNKKIWNEPAQIWEVMSSFRGWGKEGVADCYFVAPASVVNKFYQKYKNHFRDIYLKGTTGQ